LLIEKEFKMNKVRKNFTRERYISLTAVAFIVGLTLILSACGFTNQGTATGSSGGSNSSTPTPIASTPTVTTVAGYGTTQGCPSDSVVSNISKANVVATITGTTSTSAAGQIVTAHVGDVIELHAPFGKKWDGPQNALAGLTLQTPSGYAQKTNNVCVWRFDAKSAGTTKLDFTSRAICKKGQMCPLFIANVEVTITVK
jgi:hypothetical protein